MSVPVQIRTVGNIEAYQTAAVRAQVGGLIVEQRVRDGQEVAAGDVLFVLDQRSFTRPPSRRPRASSNATPPCSRRPRTTWCATPASSRRTWSASSSTTRPAPTPRACGPPSSSPRPRSSRPASSSNTPPSPRPSQAGWALCWLNVGNVIKANDDRSLLVINQVQPIYAVFSVPEQHLPAITARLGKEPLPVQAFLAGDDTTPELGRLNSVENTVDRATGTLKLKALFDNKNKRLWPGQFVRCVLTLGQRQGVVTVPAHGRADGSPGPLRVRGDPGQDRRAAAGGDPGDPAGPRHHHQGPLGRRDRGHRRPHPPGPGHGHGRESRARAARRPRPRARPSEPLQAVHRPAGHDHPGHGRHHDLRGHGLPEPAGLGPAQRGLSHHPGHGGPLRGQPGDHGRLRGHAPGEAVLHHRRPGLHEFQLHPGPDQDHPAVRPGPQHRRRRPGRELRHHPGHAQPAPGPDHPALLPQGQPGGPAHPDAGGQLPHHAPVRPERIRRDPHGPAHLHGLGRVPGGGLRLPEIRRAHPAQPRGPGLPGDRRGRGGQGRARGQRQPARGRGVRPHARIHRAGHGTAPAGRGLRPGDRGLPGRRSGAALRGRRRLRLRGGGQAAQLVQRPALLHPGHHAPARHQHRGRGPGRQGTSCPPSRPSCPPRPSSKP